MEVNKDEDRPEPPRSSLPMGMDLMVKDHFDNFRSNGERPPELDHLGVEAEPYPDEDFLNDARHWNSPPKWEDPETGTVLYGGVDDLLLSENDKIIVIDYKTRGFEPKEETGAPDYYSRQVNLYNLILRGNDYETEDFGLILYYYPDKVKENGDIIFHKEWRRVEVDIPKAKQMVRDVRETVEGPKPEPDPECDYCDWNRNGQSG